MVRTWLGEYCPCSSDTSWSAWVQALWRKALGEYPMAIMSSADSSSSNRSSLHMARTYSRLGLRVPISIRDK